MKTLKDFLSESKKELDSSFISKIKEMTSKNLHTEARIYICKLMGEQKIAKMYELLLTLHDDYYNYIGNSALDVRNKFEPHLKTKLRNTYANSEEIIKAL